MQFFRRLLPDSIVEKCYIDAGSRYEDARHRCQHFTNALGPLANKWSEWENEYARRGYRTLSLDDFANFEDVDDKLRQKRDAGEHPEYFARKYARPWLRNKDRIKVGGNIEGIVKRTYGPEEQK